MRSFTKHVAVPSVQANHSDSATLRSITQWMPAAAGVHLVMDDTIAKSECFACTDGTPTCFVKLRTADLLEKYLRGLEVQFI